MDRLSYSSDLSDLHKTIRNSWQQVESAWRVLGLRDLRRSRIDNIIIAGLGGSAISGDILKNFLGDELKLPAAVNRTYNLPSYAGENTLVIASSYSGNTEETLSAFKSGIDKGCTLIALTTGGDMERLALEKGVPVVKLQPGYQPRYALYNSFFTLLKVMQELEFADIHDSFVAKIAESLKKLGNELGSEKGEAFKVAYSLKGFVPVIYSVTDLNDSVGRRFKCQLNENSKVHAWAAEYPEMNHNEITGWERVKSSGVNYKVVTIWDDSISPGIRKRIDVINKLLSGENIDILKIQGSSETFKERLIETAYFCDWVSYFLAILNGEDPGEIDFIHHLKNRMLEN